MASVTYTTEQGTQISGVGFKSESSFEILKAAVALIENVEQAEVAGTAGEILSGVMTTRCGSEGLLFLTNNPKDVAIGVRLNQPISPEDKAQIEAAGGFVIPPTGELEEDDDDVVLPGNCDDPSCPCHDQEAQNFFQFLAELLEAENPEAENLTQHIQLIQSAYDELETVLTAFQQTFQGRTDNGVDPLEAIDELGTVIRDFADHLPENHPAKGSLYTFGAGLSVSVGMLAELDDDDE
jgi:hypothetical protein